MRSSSGSRRELRVRLGVAERVHPRLVAHQHAEAAARDLRPQVRAAPRSRRGPRRTTVASRSGCVLLSITRNVIGFGAVRAEADHPLELGVHRVRRVAALDPADPGGHDLEHAVAGLGHRRRAGSRPRPAAANVPGTGLAAQVAVAGRAAGREAERAGLERLARTIAVHRLEVVVGRRRSWARSPIT